MELLPPIFLQQVICLKISLFFRPGWSRIRLPNWTMYKKANILWCFGWLLSSHSCNCAWWEIKVPKPMPRLSLKMWSGCYLPQVRLIGANPLRCSTYDALPKVRQHRINKLWVLFADWWVVCWFHRPPSWRCHVCFITFPSISLSWGPPGFLISLGLFG